MTLCDRCCNPILIRAGVDRPPRGLCEKCHQEEEKRKAEHLRIQPIKEVGSGLIVWRFDEAPKVYQEMSRSGGDEDWVVLIPPGFNHDVMPFWLESLDSGRDPEIYTIAEGFQILIGSH